MLEKIDDPNLQPIAELMRKLLPLRHHVVRALWLDNQAGAYMTLRRGETRRRRLETPASGLELGGRIRRWPIWPKGSREARGWSTSPSAMPWVSGDRRRTKCPYASFSDGHVVAATGGVAVGQAFNAGRVHLGSCGDVRPET